MENTHNGAIPNGALPNGVIHNGAIHPTRIRVPETATAFSRVEAPKHVRLSHSLNASMASRIRDLAYETRTSESAIVECALWLFFKNDEQVSLAAYLHEAGIAPRRRRN